MPIVHGRLQARMLRHLLVIAVLDAQAFHLHPSGLRLQLAAQPAGQAREIVEDLEVVGLVGQLFAHHLERVANDGDEGVHEQEHDEDVVAHEDDGAEEGVAEQEGSDLELAYFIFILFIYRDVYSRRVHTRYSSIYVLTEL